LRDKAVLEKFETTGWVVENLGSADAAKFIAKDQEDKIKVAKAVNMIPK